MKFIGVGVRLYLIIDDRIDYLDKRIDTLDKKDFYASVVDSFDAFFDYLYAH